MTKEKLNGNLYAVDFYYFLEKDGQKDFFSKIEILTAIKNAINENLTKHNNDFKKPCPNLSNHFRYDDSQGEYCPICKYTMNKGQGFIKS